jgi:dTMP kinase
VAVQGGSKKLTGKGILFSFEGIDASGKDTQSRLLCQKLRSDGLEIEYLSFPDYTTDIGREIEGFLLGRKNHELETRHVLYAANRYEHKKEIEKFLESKIVVVNRYCDSNIAYGAAAGLPIDWLRGLEARMPQADYTFLLKVDPRVSANRMKDKRKDIFERDLTFLSRVSEVYDAISERGKWFVIDGERPIDSIHYEVWQLARELIRES